MELLHSSIQLGSAKICRICLQSAEKSSDLFSNEKHSTEILNKIYNCFQLSLSHKQYYPSSICSKCIEDLNVAYKFRQNCETFEKRFFVLSEDTNAETIYRNIYDIEEGHDQSILEKNIKKEDEVKVKHLNFLCSICEKLLKSEASLNKHKISMHQTRKHKVSGFGVNRRYHCIKCSYSTPHSQTLVNHMRKHSGDRPFHCECGKSFTQSASLNSHQKIHSDTTYFTCSKCGKQFKHAFSLKKHLNVHETGKFTCDICKKQLKSKQTLQDHIYRHYNIKNYNCEDCGRTFVTCSELLNHKRKHELEKKLECHLCGYKTRTKKSLIIHLKRHAGDKSHKCDTCCVSFFTSGDLLRHKRVHTREKPFPCPTCTQRFTHSTSLNKHLKLVHRIDCKWADIKMKSSRNGNIIENIVKVNE